MVGVAGPPPSAQDPACAAPHDVWHVALSPDSEALALAAAGEIGVLQAGRWYSLATAPSARETALAWGQDGVLLVWSHDTLSSFEPHAASKVLLTGRAYAPALARRGGRTAVVLERAVAIGDARGTFVHLAHEGSGTRNAVDLTGATTAAFGHSTDCDRPEGIAFGRAGADRVHTTDDDDLLLDVVGNSGGWFYATGWELDRGPTGGHDVLYALRPGRKHRLLRGARIGPLAVAPDQETAVVVVDATLVRLRADQAPQPLTEVPDDALGVGYSGSAVAVVGSHDVLQWDAVSGWRSLRPACTPDAGGTR